MNASPPSVRLSGAVKLYNKIIDWQNTEWIDDTHFKLFNNNTLTIKKVYFFQINLSFLIPNRKANIL